MLNEVKGQNPHEMTISEIHNTMVQIQMASTRILMAIDILLRADGCAEEMEDDLPDDGGHPIQSLTHIPNVGPVELRRAADLIKSMGSKPEDAKSDEYDPESKFDLLSNPLPQRAQTGGMMGYTDKSIWLCPRCVTVITNLEYVHLNRNGCCEECETKLEQYEKVAWRP